MALRPLRNSFLFVFTNETAEGKFIEKTGSGIILTNQDIQSQANFARWGKVVAVGDEVKTFGVGDLVLIESLQWTTGFTHDDVKVWKSDETKVIGTTTDPKDTFEY